MKKKILFMLLVVFSILTTVKGQHIYQILVGQTQAQNVLPNDTIYSNVGATIYLKNSSSVGGYNISAWYLDDMFQSPLDTLILGNKYHKFIISCDIQKIYSKVSGSYSDTVYIAPNPIGNSGTISGYSTVCKGQSQVNYTVPTITSATSYNWTLPNGATGSSTTNSINVSFGTFATTGNITVQGRNTCDSSNISTLPITVNSIPIAVDTIFGEANVCQNQNVTYTTPITNATSYIWTIPAGSSGASTTNSININYGTSLFPNFISVKGHNTCGDGVSKTLPITVNQLPTAPTISAPAICSKNGIFTITGTAGNTVTYTGITGTPVSPVTIGAGGTVVVTDTNVITNKTITITSVSNATCTINPINLTATVTNASELTPTITNTGNNVLHSDAPSRNQWYKLNLVSGNYEIISGAINQNYTASTNGSYYVIVSNATCSSEHSNIIQITNTGIEEAKTNAAITLYPNPTKNQINVKIATSLIGSQYTITDQLGRKVLTGKLTAETSIIELGNLANGIYLFRVGENIQQTFKVVKE